MANAGSPEVAGVPGRTAAPAPPRVLKLLGGFEYSRDGEPVHFPLTAQRVTAFVALNERPLSRLHVAATLWPDVHEARATASLRSALWRLSRNGDSPLEATSCYLRLAHEVALDYHHTIARSRRLLDPAAAWPDEYLDEQWFFTDLLPDWYEDWVLLERERYRQLRLHALESIAVRMTKAGRLGHAVETALMAIREEPLRESAHRVLVAAHLAEGNRGEAIRQYRQYRKLLHDELGVEPSQQFEHLIGDLLHRR